MIKSMIKVCVFIYFVGVGLHLTMQYAKADEYTTATTAHIITQTVTKGDIDHKKVLTCLLYTSPSPRDGLLSRMPSSA